MTLKAALIQAKTILSEAGCDTPALEAELLMCKALGIDRTRLLIESERELSTDDIALFDALLSRRAKREPLPYILGEWEFYGIKLEVSPAVLIPRPETEILVDTCLHESRKNDAIHQSTLESQLSTISSVTIIGADVGTGSGAIAISLAKQLPELHVIAIDTSPDAIALAKRNIQRHQLEKQITPAQGNLLDAEHTTHNAQLDFIVANLPYIPTDVIPKLQPEVKDYEPRAALDGGPDGLDFIRQLITQAPECLKPGGFLALEISPEQAAEVTQLLSAAGFERCEIINDLAGRSRVALGYMHLSA